MKPPRKRPAHGGSMLWNLLTLEQLMTGSVAHLVYWMGLGVIALVGFGAIGGSVGVALREGDVMGWLLAVPVFVAGVLVVAALALLWRSFCEFFVVVMRIGEDLSALRRASEAQTPAAADSLPPRV